jgi:hypothetical protein
MQTESLIDRLSRDLRPVRRLSVVRESLFLLLLEHLLRANLPTPRHLAD